MKGKQTVLNVKKPFAVQKERRKVMNAMKRTTLALALGLVALGAARNAQAAGTAAGTDIRNTATINYDVGGNPQPPKDSNEVIFKVDRKINLTVSRTDGSIVQVTPGQTTAFLTFSVKNDGNAAQDFSLQAIAEATSTLDPFSGGNNDNFDATLVGVYVESGGSAGYLAAEDTATSITALPADGVKTVYIVVSIPNTRINNDVAVYALKATATGVTETAGADDPNTVDTVFADAATSDDDGARKGDHSDRSAFKVKTAVLTVAKSSQVIWDPANLFATPKAIPGAKVEYTVTVSNAAGAIVPATNIAITDNLNSEITAGKILFNTDAYASGKGIQLTIPNLYSGAATPLSNANDGDEGKFASNTVTVSGIALAPGESATIKYQVVIQ
jgi:uncharacterized repeat protein (TIGR01451 family)